MMNGILKIRIVSNEGGVEKNVRKDVKKTGRSKSRLREPRVVEHREVVPIAAADNDSCGSIWQSVVVQAFYDLISESKALEQKLEKAEAVAWFGQGMVNGNGAQTDFAMVCELGALDPYAMLNLAREVIHGDKKKVKQVLSGFNFRTLRRDSSNRAARKDL